MILITDPEHAVPVQIQRNGLRTIAVGAGDTASLALPYLPANADVKSGDLLLTSGLGGVFPAGYPVARVTEVHRDAVQPLAQVRATPLGRIDLDREAMLVWFRSDHPAAPGTAEMGDSTSGSPKMQPQKVPVRPAAVPTPTATSPQAASGTVTSGSAGQAGAANPPPAAVKPTPKPATKPKAQPRPESPASEPEAAGPKPEGGAKSEPAPKPEAGPKPETPEPKPAATTVPEQQ